MSRCAWFVSLLLATGVVLAQDAPDGAGVAGAAEARPQGEQAQ